MLAQLHYYIFVYVMYLLTLLPAGKRRQVTRETRRLKHYVENRIEEMQGYKIFIHSEV